jgi:restriction endonuclease S subunit
MVRIAELVRQVTNKIKVDPIKEYKLAGVKWYGEGLFHRETVAGSSISATYLTPLVPGAFIYNRLFAWKESFAVVPEALGDCFVSNEFPQFHVDSGRILSRYLYLFCMCRSTIKSVNKASIGSAAVSRNRFKEEYFLDFFIPLPPLIEQQAIVDKWEQAKKDILAARQEIVRQENEPRDVVSNELGIATRSSHIKPRSFAVCWNKISRWGFDMCWNAIYELPAPKFSAVLIKEICHMGSGGTPSRKINAYYDDGDIPWVKTTEVRNEVIMNTGEKITRLGLKNSAAKLYPPGSLLIAMYGQGATRGRTAKLGIEAATNQACCVLYNVDPRVDIDYLWFFLINEYDELRKLASGNNQPNLNSEMIANYEIPLPPLEKQRQIVEQVNALRLATTNCRKAIGTFTKTANAEIEDMVMGTKRSHREQEI